MGISERLVDAPIKDLYRSYYNDTKKHKHEHTDGQTDTMIDKETQRDRETNLWDTKLPKKGILRYLKLFTDI